MKQTATDRRIHFDQIVEQARMLHQQDPNAYQKKLKMLAWLGYGYLLLILMLCVGVIGGLIVMSIKSTAFLLLLIKSKFIIVVLVVMYVIVRSLMVRIPPPEGVRLKRSDAPELFATIEQMRNTLKTPRIHEVVITPELNAAIQQTPRLGIFGWQRNSLILGLELLLFMKPVQVKAVIGHEMGHLSGGHARFNGWIYRLRMTWMNILYTVSQIQGVAQWVFGKFFNWYAPYFNAYSFSLARANEYEADQIAVQLTSAKDLSEGLVGMHVVADGFFNRFYRQVERQAIKHADLTPAVYTRISQAYAEHAFDPAQVKRAISRSLKIKTGTGDTHPALKDRVMAVEGEARFNPGEGPSAADAWFGERFDDLLKRVGETWFDWHGPQLSALHQQASEAKQREAELLQKSELCEEDRLELGHIQLFLRQKNKALKQFKKVYDDNPTNPHALYQLGSALLERQQAKGVQLLEQLMEHEDFAQAAGEQLYGWYELHDETDKASQIQLKLEQHSDLEADFHAELSHLSRRDVYQPIELSAEQTARLKESLQKYIGIVHVWVAAKKLQTRPHVPFLVIVFELEQGEDEKSVFSDQQHPIVFDGYFTLVNHDNRKLSKVILKHANQLY